MPVNPVSLANLDKGREARAKNAIRVNVSLKPSTHERLKTLPLNVSASIDRIVEWVAAAGKVEEIFLAKSKITHNGIEEVKLENIQDTHDRIQEVKLENIQDTHDRIQEVKLENQALKAELDLIKSKNDSQLPDAAILLNQLKAKRKKSKIDLQDVEAILEMIEQAD